MSRVSHAQLQIWEVDFISWVRVYFSLETMSYDGFGCDYYQYSREFMSDACRTLLYVSYIVSYFIFNF